MANHQLFRYPPMERQDLDQSQLGSFKFTPVDPVNDIQSLTQNAAQILQQQLSQKQRIPDASTSSAEAFPDDGSTLSSGRAPPQLMSSGNTSYFNEHIKPDLRDSRLRLGPAVLRTAVDGGSPAKKFTYMEPDLNAKHNRPNNPMSPPQVISPQFLANSMDPTAANFMPTTDLHSAGISDSASVTGTLFNALANEQHAHINEKGAHNATKADLAQQITICAEQAKQLEAYERKIAQMQTQLDLLKAIVKHNASQRDSDEMESNKEARYSEDAADPGLNKYYRETRKLKKTDNQEEGTKGEQVDHADPLQDEKPTNDAAHTVAAASANEVVDDLHLFNLDLLQNLDSDNSIDPALRRTLRKQFSIDSSADDGKPPSKKRGSLYNLVNIATESVGSVRDMPVSSTSVNGNLSPAQTRLPVGEQIDMHRSTETDKQQDTTDPAVTPEDFDAGHHADVTYYQSEGNVTECGDKSAPAPLEQKPNGADLNMQHLKKLESLRIGPEARSSSQDEDYGRLTPVSSACDGDVQTTPADPSTSRPTKIRLNFKMETNLYGVTKWRVHKDNPIFEDEQEKWDRIGDNGLAFHNSSQFWNHPVRYLPEAAAVNANAYRTVMINGIPVGSTMAHVLSIVKGGPIEKIQLFPPIGGSMPSMTARVVFVYERSAHNMIKHQEAKPGLAADLNRFRVQSRIVRCWMPSDPTYPRKHYVDRAIFGELRATRILVIHNVDEYTFNMIPYKVKSPHDQHVIAYSYVEEDNAVGHAILEFSDIETAIKVKNEMDCGSGLWTNQIQYVEDYTCVPYPW
ncbi:hypothetical protein H2200_012969 [Cladophialophora chaetospira]|uniref:Uncharacterized protein n=1 Tax=Cladophialophora chaetospira TaxID=386627 RepID=A0AA38WWJ2_9EURO|nr:hypothetical protein H2200_012969 [Cladophialophora chaetospira]